MFTKWRREERGGSGCTIFIMGSEKEASKEFRPWTVFSGLARTSLLD